MDWYFTNFEWITNDFEMRGIGIICEYHDNICICRPAGAAVYTDYEGCFTHIGAIPRYSAAYGPKQPSALNSLSCRWKHHFVAAIVPETHCKHVGPNTLNGEGALKCLVIYCLYQFSQAVNERSRPDGQRAHQIQLL
jgi:hypothetical protein